MNFFTFSIYAFSSSRLAWVTSSTSLGAKITCRNSWFLQAKNCKNTHRKEQDRTWQDRTYHQATWHSIPSLFSTIRCLPQPTQPYAQTFAGLNDNETTFNPIKRIENKTFLLATLSCRQPAQNSLKICFQHWSTMKRDEWGAQQNAPSNMQIYENICTWIPLILSTPPRFGFICGRLPRPRCASTSGKGQLGGNVGILGDLNLVASKRAVACLLPHILFATVCRSKSVPTLETRPKPDQIDRFTDWWFDRWMDRWLDW